MKQGFSGGLFVSRRGALGLLLGALLVAAAAFALYWPSLRSGFVYDAQIEILEEGYVTDPGHLPEVLSLGTLRTTLLLAGRPGQILYFMGNGALWGKKPFGYHLSSNLLHAADAALLFLLLCRLAPREGDPLCVRLAAGMATLLFALHPVATESVAEVSFSSSLLVAFFTLAALLAATAFDPGKARRTFLPAAVAIAASLAAVTSKESGLSVFLALVLYWAIFRRNEAQRPWLLLLGGSAAVTVAFLAARFLLAPPDPTEPTAIGSTFWETLWAQPRLWVFMMGKLLWPAHLSADYIPSDLEGLQPWMGWAILPFALTLQGWLAWRSRVGAFGVGLYWAGLATVSNLVPLYHPVADRFYYLPLAGFAAQLFALFLLLAPRRRLFLAALGCALLALPPLAWRSLQRQKVFASEESFATLTLRDSPASVLAHLQLGVLAGMRGDLNTSIAEFDRCIALNPNSYSTYLDRAKALTLKGDRAGALADMDQAIRLRPTLPQGYHDRGFARYGMGDWAGALLDLRKCLALDPRNGDPYLRYFLWTIEVRDPAQREAADRELAAYVDSHPGARGAWTPRIGPFLLGRLTPEEFRQQAEAMPEAERNGDRCEAFYYLGIARIVAGKPAEAIPFFHQAAATGKKDYTEYQTAAWWLGHGNWP